MKTSVWILNLEAVNILDIAKHTLVNVYVNYNQKCGIWQWGWT
jgi:hypothetical protein